MEYERDGDSIRSHKNDTGTPRQIGMLAQLNRRSSRRRVQSRTTTTKHSDRRKRHSFKQVNRDTAESCRRLVPIVWTLLVLAVIVTGIVVAFSHSTVGGWSLVGVGFLFAIIGLVLSKYCEIQRKKTAALARQADAQTMKFYHTNMEDFPADPVLRRGITNIVYHRLLREKEWSSHRNHPNDRPCNLKNRKVALKHCHPNPPATSSGHANTDAKSTWNDDQDYADGDAQEDLHHHNKPCTSQSVPYDIDNDSDVSSVDRNSNNNNSSRIKKHRSILTNGQGVHHFTRNSENNTPTNSRAVTTKDSILMAKKRRHIRNKEWNIKRKTAELGQRIVQEFSLRTGSQIKEMTTSMESLSRIETSRTIDSS